MATLCNDCEVRGKTHQIWCKHTGEPCFHVRYCAVSSRYYQTDAAKDCKVKRSRTNERKSS